MQSYMTSQPKVSNAVSVVAPEYKAPTITNFIGAWLVSSRHYANGKDLLQRVCKDARLLNFFRNPQSDYLERRLTEEIERLSYEFNTAPVPETKELSVTEGDLETLDLWLNGDRSYYEGVKMLSSMTGNESLAPFFLHEITAYGQSLLAREIEKLFKELQRLQHEEQAGKAPAVTIKDLLRHWLYYSDRNYVHGVNLFSVLNEDASLLAFFQGYESEYKRGRLVQELEKIYDAMKGRTTQLHAEPAATEAAATTGEAPARAPRNPELEQAAERKASMLYKQMMNDRAVLFNLTKVEAWDDANRPDLVEQRRKLALSVVNQNYEVSQAYDDLEHVRQHGTLPYSEYEEAGDAEVQDLDLKPTIDNLRKNINKLKGKEPTPEPVAMIQKHEARLEALLQRWNALKQAT